MPLKCRAESLDSNDSTSSFSMLVVRDFLREHYAQVLFMNVYPSTVLRADRHADENGLHYCLPGPVDNWNVFHYNILRALEVG
ncbi:hypothetical protein B484DRAFT_412506 [Ochromonadaceae sp. CCMP2298]|nr:hypothetical protein B484DRAFT_412506 [Ochromonadaceae sp. CCMP2298]